MYCLAAFFIIGALGTTPSVLALDCLDANAWESEVRTCFKQSGLSVDAHTVADLETAILSNTSYNCRNTGAFKSAVSCAMGILRNCLISMWEDPAILPDDNKVTDGLVYLCDHIADFDAECSIETLPTIEKCAERKVLAALSVSSDLSFKFGVCTLMNAYKDCVRQQLGVCPRRTKEIAVNLFTYVTPAACSGGDLPRSTVGDLQRSTVGALGTTPSVLALDCDKENARVSREMRQCYTQSGYSVPVDAHTAADVETAMLTAVSYACRNTEAFRSAVSCVVGIYRNCLISMSKDPAILPDANKVTDGLVYLCDHIADFDAECLIGTSGTIAQCARRKTHAAHSVPSNRSLKFIICTTLDAAEDCVRQHLGVCPRRTKEIAVNLFTYVTPAACSGGDLPRSTVGDLPRSTVGDLPRSTVGTSAGGASCVFLLFAALLAVIFRY